MAFYYDSSLILSAILEEDRIVDFAASWDNLTIRLSSNLLQIECIIGIRRAGALLNLSPDDDWIGRRIDILESYFSGIHFKIMDSSIEKTIRDNSSIARCRSLDAIHLSTALYFKPNLDEPLYIATLDHRLRKAADELGFDVFPKEL
jgi:hypothetical protein